MLPTDPKQRKERPIARGVLDYFPDAIAAVANVSFVGNQQHNPGEEMHWAREKSTDHADCIARHLVERGTIDTDQQRHSAKMAWRSLALLQLELEAVAKKDQQPNTVIKVGPSKYDIPSAIPRDGEPVMLMGHPMTMTFVQSLCGHSPDLRATTLIGDSRKEWERRERIRILIKPTYGFYSAFPKSRSGRVFYIAGPMRGVEFFNFPAFDAARDLGHSRGHGIISPADIDRKAGFKEKEVTQEAVSSEACAREFAERDALALLSLRGENGDGIALLPGWEKSTGAVAEFFFARWLGLRVVNAKTFETFSKFDWSAIDMAALYENMYRFFTGVK